MKTSPRYSQFAAHLLQLSQARGIGTQGELAQRLGVKQQTTSRWEAGTSRPRADEMSGIAAVTGRHEGATAGSAYWRHPRIGIFEPIEGQDEHFGLTRVMAILRVLSPPEAP